MLYKFAVLALIFLVNVDHITGAEDIGSDITNDSELDLVPNDDFTLDDQGDVETLDDLAENDTFDDLTENDALDDPNDPNDETDETDETDDGDDTENEDPETDETDDVDDLDMDYIEDTDDIDGTDDTDDGDDTSVDNTEEPGSLDGNDDDTSGSYDDTDDDSDDEQSNNDSDDYSDDDSDDTDESNDSGDESQSGSDDADSDSYDDCIEFKNDETSCGEVESADGDDECGYNTDTGDCYSIVRRAGTHGTGNFDDGYNAANEAAAQETGQLYTTVGVLGGIIGALVLVISGGIYYMYNKDKGYPVNDTEMDELSQQTANVQGYDDGQGLIHRRHLVIDTVEDVSPIITKQD